MNTRPSLVDRSILTSPPQVYSIDNGMPKGLSINSSSNTTVAARGSTVALPPSSTQGTSKKGIVLNILLISFLGLIGFFLWRRSKTYKPEPSPPPVGDNIQGVKPINYH